MLELVHLIVAKIRWRIESRKLVRVLVKSIKDEPEKWSNDGENKLDYHGLLGLVTFYHGKTATILHLPLLTRLRLIKAVETLQIHKLRETFA